MEDHDKKCDQFIVFVKKISSMQDAEISRFFDKNEMKTHNKEFASVCLTNIVKIWFKYFKNDFKQSLLLLDIDSILTGLSKLIKDAITKLRDDFSTKLWRNCFQSVIFGYMSSLIETHKAKKEADLIFKLVLKIDDDLNKIIKFFQTGKIDKPTIEKNTKPISDFKNFLNCNPTLVGIVCQSLKRDFPGDINAKVLCVFIDMRTDIDEKEKKETKEAIKETMELMSKDKKEDAKEETAPAFLRRQSTRTQVFDALKQSQSGSLLTQGLTLTIAKAGGVESEGNDKCCTKKSNDHDIEGYLDVFKDCIALAFASILNSKVEWKPHFFSIKNLHLYCYKDHKSHRAEFKIPLDTLDTCDSVKEGEFKLTFKDGKQFTASGQGRERDVRMDGRVPCE